MSPFWYRRICEIALLVSVIVLGLFGLGWMLGSGSLGAELMVPTPAVIAAGITAVVSFIGYVTHSKRTPYFIALVTYLLLTLTVASMVFSTGQTSSPFIALWMFVAVFAGLFGLVGLLPLVLAINGFFLYLYFGLGVQFTEQELFIVAIAYELPLLVSFLIWHGKSSGEAEKEKAFSALEAQLSQVANKSEIVINAIADGVIALDGKSNIQLINPAAQTILGWAKDDALGLDYHSVIKLTNEKGEATTDVDDPIQQVFRSNKSLVNDDLLLTTVSNKQLNVSILVSPVGQQGSGAIVVFRDITQQKQEERQQAEFISTASHEMRTPVAAIEGYLGLALNPQTATIDDKARVYLAKAHESAQHLGRLFQDLLDVSKAEDGRLKNTPNVVDVTALVRDVVAMFELKAGEKGIGLIFKPGSGEGDQIKHLAPVFYAFVDPDHLREVAANLVENAIKYTLAGEVSVDVTGDDKHVTLSITDTGIGIPPEDAPHLFQKFYRVDNSDTRQIGGTGLGLYLCRRLAEAMNGHIWVKSEFGKGSTFFVELPRLSHDEATHALQQQQALQAKQAQQTRQTPQSM